MKHAVMSGFCKSGHIRIMIVGVDCIIRIMDVSSAKDVCQFEKHQATIYSLTFSRDGSVLVSGMLSQYER